MADWRNSYYIPYAVLQKLTFFGYAQMFHIKKSVDLSAAEIEVIEAALHTQEKILSMQSRAGGDNSAALRLSQLKSVLRSLRRQSIEATSSQNQSFTAMARSFFG